MHRKTITRSALKLPETTRARPPPEDRIAEPDPDIKTKTEPRTIAASPLLITPTLPRTPPTLTTPGWHPVQNPPPSTLGPRRHGPRRIATYLDEDPDTVASRWTPTRSTWTSTQMASQPATNP